MAFTSTIKPYKFVNPSSIKSKGGGATIIAGGKTITGGATSQVKSARVTMLAINRIGMAMEGLGKTQQQIRDIIVYENKYLTRATAFRKKREGYRRDQKSEDVTESFGKKEQENVAKEVEKKEKKKLGWLEKIFGPFAGIIAFVGRIVITQTVLRWMGDGKNQEKLTTFVESFGKVFKWAYNIAYKSVDAVMTGFEKVFGSSDKKGLDRFGEVISGLGTLLFGIAGFKALGYLLNPFSLVNDIVGLIDALEKRAQAGGPSGPGDSNLPGGGPNQLSKSAQKVGQNYGGDAARYYDDLIKRGKKPAQALTEVRKRFPKLPPAPKGPLGKLRQGVTSQIDNLKSMRGQAQANLKKMGMGALDLWGKFKVGAKNARKGVLTGIARAGEWTRNIGVGLFNEGKKIAGAAGNWLQASKAQLKKMGELISDPKKLRDYAQNIIQKNIEPAIKKNPIGKQALDLVKNPKKIGPAAKKLLDTATKSKQMKDTLKYLKKAKAAAKIGGLDKIIAIIEALLLYGMPGGMPLTNAVLSALGGLLGYTAGFALGAPFGGAPGFITGMAGGFAGDFVGKALARTLAKMTPLGKTQDPIMKDRMLASDDPELAVGGIVDRPTRAIIGEKGPEAVIPLSKFGGGAIASTLIGATDSALSRMGAAGEIARSLIGPDLQEAERLFGTSKVSAGGGDSLGKTVDKGVKGEFELGGEGDVSSFIGDEKVNIRDTKSPGNQPTTLRGQLANILGALIWVSKKKLGGGGSGKKSSDSSGPGSAVYGTKNAKAVLNAIAEAEGTDKYPNGGYNTHFAGDQTEDLSAHPAIIKRGGGHASDAFGRYQFMSPTWAGLGGAVKAHDGKPAKDGFDMSKENQDKGALKLIEQKGINIEDGLDDAEIRKIGQIWASVKGGGYGQDKYDEKGFLALYHKHGGDEGGGTKSAARGGFIPMAMGGFLGDPPPGVGKNRRPRPKDEGRLRVLKGEAMGGLVKFASGGAFQNGRLPDSALQSIGGGHKLKKGPVADSFINMAKAAKKDGVDLIGDLTGSYRDYAGQEYMYSTKPAGMAAVPGTSKHGWGIAVDIGYARSQDWVNSKGAKFGWALPDWAKGGFEPWHFEKTGETTGPTTSGGDDSDSDGGDVEEPQKDPWEAFQEAMTKLNSVLGYAPPPTQEATDTKKNDKKPSGSGSDSSPSTSRKPTAKTSPTPASSGSGSKITSDSSAVERLAEAAETAGSHNIVPLPINTSSNVAAADAGQQVSYARPTITYSIAT